MSLPKFPQVIYRLHQVNGRSARKQRKETSTICKNDIDAFLGDLNYSTRPKSTVHHNMQTVRDTGFTNAGQITLTRSLLSVHLIAVCTSDARLLSSSMRVAGLAQVLNGTASLLTSRSSTVRTGWGAQLFSYHKTHGRVPSLHRNDIYRCSEFGFAFRRRLIIFGDSVLFQRIPPKIMNLNVIAGINVSQNPSHNAPEISRPIP